MTDAVLIAVVGGGSATVAGIGVQLLNQFFNRKLAKANATISELTVQEKVANLQAAEVTRLVGKVQVLEGTVQGLESSVQTITKRARECEQQHKAHGIEMRIIKSYIKEKKISIAPIKIFLLDDDDLERYMFQKLFDEIDIVELEIFEDIPTIEKRLNTDSPEILVLDYRINGMNIDGLIKNILQKEEYKPKVIIMSGISKEMFMKLPYTQFVWHFYNKDQDDYRNDIKNEILQYIEDKVK